MLDVTAGMRQDNAPVKGVLKLERDVISRVKWLQVAVNFQKMSVRPVLCGRPQMRLYITKITTVAEASQ